MLRYGRGQYYHAHSDVLPDDKAGPRVATVLLYFGTPEAGGETSFPSTGADDWLDAAARDAAAPALSDCARGHVAFKPVRGDALVFWSVMPDGATHDGASMHEGCPVVAGVKWTGARTLARGAATCAALTSRAVRRSARIHSAPA